MTIPGAGPRNDAPVRSGPPGGPMDAPPAGQPPRRRRLIAIAAAVIAVLVVVLLVTRRGPREAEPDLTPLDDAGRRELRDLTRRAETIEAKIRALRPRGTFLIIDTGRNRLTLVKSDKPVLEAVCSTGSGRALADPARKRRWVFDTPRGEFFIRAKHPNPVWIKPDWAFLEVGDPIPRKWAERLAPMELGDYAMDLGDGYLIHGTLYPRALGLSVTHGCVRLGDDDLDTVYHTARIGTPVYIY